MKQKPAVTIVLLAVVVGGASGANKLGLLKIFNHFIEVTDLVGQLHPILQNIGNDIVDDIRRLIPEVEKLLDKYNISKEIPPSLGKVINMTYISGELVPELERELKNSNLTEQLAEIRSYLDMTKVEKDVLPEYAKFVDENNITDIFKEIRKILNVSFIADALLPELERSLEGENISAIIAEIHKFFDLRDVVGNVLPAIANILESDNITQVLAEVNRLVNISNIADQLLPELDKAFTELKLNETIAEVRKFLNIGHEGHKLLDEVQKIMDEVNITAHVPDLVPFLNLSIIREKLPEVQRILDYTNISDIVDELERLLDVSYVKEKVPELDEFLEGLGVSTLLRDIKKLLDIAVIKDEVTEIKKFLRSANLTHGLDEAEKLLNATYIRDKIVPEIERMFRESNLTDYIGEVEKLLNTSYIAEKILPEIEKMMTDFNIRDQVDMILRFLNMTYLKEQLVELDKQFNITRRGERISQGELAEVVNGVLDDLFKKEEIVMKITTPSPTDSSKEIPTTEAPVVCINDCQGVPCGTAVINSCRECVLGTTGRTIDHGKDCNNVCGGRARNDSCGACSNPPANDRTGTDSPFADCFGTCFGSAVTDSCGDCSGGRSGKAVDYRKDACGVCGGNNSTCKGCDGIPNSGKVNDSCNVCGGDGSSCTTISMTIPSLLPSSSASRTVLVIGAGLNGDDSNAIKCVFNGQETTGESVNLTHCRCTIPDNLTPGDKDFMVKVVKNRVEVSTALLKIKIYDATTTKINTFDPVLLFSEEMINATFTGEGFFDSTAAVCIVDGRKIKATFVGGNYKCTVPPFRNSKQVNFALSLNGVHELNTDATLRLTVYARAPMMRSAQFSKTGAQIKVVFDKYVETSSLATCADIFDSVANFGLSEVCSWADGRHLIISPGANFTVHPGIALTLKANAVKRAKELYSKFASGSVTILEPTNPVQPVPMIFGPTQISSCGNLSLDASRSNGGGGRSLKYKWTLIGASNSDITSVLNNARDKARVFINGNFMNAGSSYTIRLEVQNFLSSTWKSASITVSKAVNPVPEVTVQGPLGDKAKASKFFYVTAKARAASCSSAKALTYSWSVVCTNDDSSSSAKIRAQSSTGFRETASKSALRIDAGSLVGGKTYKFIVVVAQKDSPSTSTTVEKTVAVEWSELEPAILGGDQTLGRGSGSLTLDAKSSTVDPDNAPGDLSCSWTCTDKSNGQPCYSAINRQEKIALPSQCVITIASSLFQDGKSYDIKSDVSKGSRIGSSSIVLTVIAGDPPKVRVLKPKIRVTASAKVRLRAVYRSKIKPVKVEWTCVQDDDNYRYVNISDASLVRGLSDKYNSGGNSFSVMILKANILTPGASYKFVLNVSDGSNVGTTNIIVEVRDGPTTGILEASPTTLQQLEIVTLKAPFWVTDSDAYPLEYEFGYLDDSDEFQPWATQTDSEFSIAAPAGYGDLNQLRLRVKVKDAFGSMKWSRIITIVVNPVSLTEGTVVALMKDRLQDAKDTGDFSKVVPEMKNILRTVGRANVPAGLAKKVAKSTVNTLLLAVNATSLDKQKAEPILKTFLQINKSYVDESKDLIGGFKKVIKASVRNLDKQTVQKTLSWVAEMSSKANLKDQSVLQDLTDVDDSLASSLADDVEFGESPIETSADDPRAVIKVAHFDLAGSVPAKSSSDATQVEFGSEMSGKYGMWECAPGKMCLGVKVKMISYKEDYYSDISSTKPSIISDKIVSVSLQNPETGDDLSVGGLSKPVKLTFKTGNPSAGKKFVCYFYNETKQEWASDGLTWAMVAGQLTLSATHLTSFTPAEEVDTGSQSSEYQVSFVLSNTTWKEGYLDSSNSERTALESEVLREITAVYQNDTTFQNVQIDRFEESGGFVKVVLRMTFDASNTNPGERLKQSVADGTLGSLQVDPNSLDFVGVSDGSSGNDDDDNTNLIIGVVVGASVGVVLLGLLIGWLVYRSKAKPSKVRSMSPPVNDYDNDGLVYDDHAMTPV